MKKQNIFVLIIGLFFLLAFVTCKNPFKSETKKELIKVLVNDYFNNESLGKWIFFWDGKNKDGRDVANGVYYGVVTLPGVNVKDARFKLAVVK